MGLSGVGRRVLASEQSVMLKKLEIAVKTTPKTMPTKLSYFDVMYQEYLYIFNNSTVFRMLTW